MRNLERTVSNWINCIAAAIAAFILCAMAYQTYSPTGRHCQTLGGQYYLIGGCVKIETTTTRIQM